MTFHLIGLADDKRGYLYAYDSQTYAVSTESGMCSPVCPDDQHALMKSGQFRSPTPRPFETLAALTDYVDLLLAYFMLHPDAKLAGPPTDADINAEVPPSTYACKSMAVVNDFDMKQIISLCHLLGEGISASIYGPLQREEVKSIAKTLIDSDAIWAEEGGTSAVLKLVAKLI